MEERKKSKNEAIALKELREEESQPIFNEGQRKVFNSRYIDGMQEALSLLDENRTVTDHLKSTEK